MMFALGVILVGLCFSAFFSGTETGFYRASRIRMALDARAGSRIASAQLWFINNPSMFVATTLVGNNFSNNLISFGIVLVTQRMMGAPSATAEIVAAILAAPLVFIYGELLPKVTFFEAPNRLLQRTGPLFLLFAVLFAPISVVLGMLAWLLKKMVGESHSQIRLRIARQELSGILVEGVDAGILGSAQMQLAQAVFNVAGARISRLVIPLERAVTVRDSETAQTIVRIATRQRASEVIVLKGATRHVLGYVRISDILTSEEDWREATRPLIAIRQDETQLTALLKMRKSESSLAEIVDTQGRTVGILAVSALIDPLFPDR